VTTASERAWRAVAVAGLSLTVVAVAQPAGTARTATYALTQAVGLAAVLLGARRAARAWYAIAVALVASIASNLLWNLEAGMVAAGWLYIAVYPPLVAGLVGLARGRQRRSGRWRPEVTLDTAILTVGVAAIYWTFLVRPVLDRPGLPDVSRQVVVVHAVLDLAVLAAGGRLFFRTGAGTTSQRLLLLSVAGTLSADVVYYAKAALTGTFAAGAFSEALWMASAVCAGLAASHPSAILPVVARRTSQPTGTLTLVLLALLGPVLTLAGVAAGERTGSRYSWADAMIPAALAAGLSVLLVLRLAVMARVARRRAEALAAQTERLATALAKQEDLQRRLTQHALSDPLTGLPNRVLLLERLERALVRRDGTHLVILDLDGFTEVNDAYGHDAGDALLVEVSHRLLGVLCGADTLARLGADQFAVLLEDATDEHAELVAAGLRDALRPRYRLGPESVTVTASVGVLSARQPVTASGALRDADLAVRAAKRAGRDRVVVFEPGLRTARLDYTRLAGRLRQALDAGELTLVYQPVVDLDTERVVAVESLLRWYPTGEDDPVSPAEFIPVAEDNGLIVPIGTWVLRTACRQAVGWYARHAVRTTVNVSGHQLRDPAFPAIVRSALDDTGLPGAALVLEITESALIAETTAEAAAARERLDAIRALGVRVAIDDFGTGYSSLSYLRHLPVDILKIDKAFVGGTSAHQDRAFLRAILQLAETLGLTTVGEGVETDEQAAMLRAMSCGLAQGFRYHRPQPPEAIDALLTRAPLSTRSA
jgi:diguanylate cyclase (GGDEF)-like protein